MSDLEEAKRLLGAALELLSPEPTVLSVNVAAVHITDALALLDKMKEGEMELCITQLIDANKRQAHVIRSVRKLVTEPTAEEPEEEE